MIRGTFVLVDPPETFDVVTDARDRRAFERDGFADCGLTPGPVSDVAKQNAETFLAYTVYAALKRTGRYLGDWKTFEGRLVDSYDVEQVNDAALLDPTTPAQSAG